MAQQGLQQILHSSCFKVVKKKQVKQKCEVKKIKSPFFPTKSENRFLSSDIVYLWKKILIHEKEHLDPWELISSKYLRNNFSFYSVLLNNVSSDSNFPVLSFSSGYFLIRSAWTHKEVKVNPPLTLKMIFLLNCLEEIEIYFCKGNET